MQENLKCQEADGERSEMEMKTEEVVLVGTWSSPFCKRVEIALKLKGIPYKYIEEDLQNKSELLLKNNPAHEKVPLLLHKGRSIVESLIILEYIDEQWPNTPKFLPHDPYQRAKIRFWANYNDHKIIPSFIPIIMSKGKEQEEAIEELSKLLKVFEEGVEKDFESNPPFFITNNGESLGLLDIIVATYACTYEAFHEIVAVIFDPNKNPTFFSWINHLKNCPMFKEMTPPLDILVAKMKQTISLSP